ncbi:MAG TPA: zinc ribbon domain-containing protein [Chloroflexota bacterium]|jgi:putative FmdB family regulatory protein|nr:zinc ribbon domain-containing protein [Chloroflexota bacterium]
MPLYEYRCRRCGAHFEKVVRWGTEDREVVCPTCAAREAERRISLPASRRSGADCAPSGGG